MKLDWKTLVLMLGPSVLANMPHGDRFAPLVPTVLHGIVEAEQIKGATDVEKKAHVASLVLDAVAGVNQVSGRQRIDPTVASLVANHGIDAVVGVVNLVHAAHQQVGILLPPVATPEQLGVSTGNLGE